MRNRHALTALLAALALLAAACGSDDADSEVGDDTSSAAVDEATSDTTAEATDDSGGEEDLEPEATGATGTGVGTLAIDGGPTYTFEMNSCETSENTDIFLVDPGYSLSGGTEDGFRLFLSRAAFEESPDLHPLGTLEGFFDEEGKNNKMAYLLDEENYDIQVDGGRVFGQATFEDFFSSEQIHGESFTATVEVDCPAVIR